MEPVASAKVARTTLSDEERKSLIELYGKSLEGFDKAVVVTSSGALVLSVTFLHDIAPKPPPDSLTTLWLGWIGLVLSLSLMIISMLTGQRALEDALAENKTAVFTTVTTWLNLLSAICLIVGLGGLAYVAQTNVFVNQWPAPALPPPCTGLR